jgi:hypothetical protein
MNANTLNYDFTAEMMQGSNRQEGIVSLSTKEFIFSSLQKQLLYKHEWKDYASYSNSIYLKENFEWNGKGDNQPEGTRCLKLIRIAEKDNNNPDYFCIYFHKNDLTKKIKLQLAEARYSANMNSNKINIRFHKLMHKLALVEIAKAQEVQGNLEIDSKWLFYVKMDIRMNYLKQRHKLISKVKLGKMKRTELEDQLKSIKEKIVEKSCTGIDTCKKAIDYCLDHKVLTLTGEREKITWDWQNPFIIAIPKTNIKVNAAKGTAGEKTMQDVNKMKGGKKDYMAESFPESPPGQPPNHISVKKAINTIMQMRSAAKEFKSTEEFSQMCNVNYKYNSNNIKRKISMLGNAGANDCFMEYLGNIRDKESDK